MNNWIAVIATLSGAAVAGTISLLVQWLSNRHAMQHTKLVLAEERARWAIEKRLDRLQAFYGTIEKLFVSIQQFRIQQAWQASAEDEPGLKIPKWVVSYEKARGEFEENLDEVARELMMLDEEIQTEYKRVDINWFRWIRSKTDEDGVRRHRACHSYVPTHPILFSE